ncbi:hypothetical protein AAV94_11535 [Lampropedia cohaerens]|uniref:Isochorismatase-like domain-containing protein n=1 Tax=Lampropedia cohaerens TaxID=1610491 RepID=A0A0U1PY45_9BURK|nr:isochorismatase family protein [Lampropedia cohaerens]KKW67444.1 hypothetical protein AAV94_11535 [Lampropedia cohaerens]
MALPTIAPYRAPAAQELPAPRHGWSLRPQRAALLVHDMQQYFLAPFGNAHPALQTAIANIQALLQACRAAGVPVFYTAQRGNQLRCDRGLQAELWGPGMRAEAAHESIHSALRPVDGEHILTKHRYSAFQRSNLDTLLRARGRDQLLITGVYAHIGCMLTAAEAFQRDIEPFLMADALADFDRARHDLALQWSAGTCATPLMTATALDALAPVGQEANQEAAPCN